MEFAKTITPTVLKAVALGLAVATIVFGALGIGTVETQVTFLGMSVFALATALLQKEN